MSMPNLPSDLLSDFNINTEELVEKAVNKIANLDIDDIKNMNREEIINLFYKSRQLNIQNISKIHSYESGIKRMLREYHPSLPTIDPKLFMLLIESINEIKKQLSTKDILSKEILHYINTWHGKGSEFKIELFILFILLLIILSQ